MNILEAIEKKFKTHGNNVVEAIKNMSAPFVVDGEPEDGAVPTYDATDKKVGWQVPQGGGGSEDFAINVNVLWSDQYGTYEVVSHDKNFEDIVAAYNSGKKLTLIMNDIYEEYPCTYIAAFSAKDMNPSPEIGTSYLFVGHFSAENTFSMRVSHPVGGEETWYYQEYSPNPIQSS